jgi:hypothetical protein
MSRTKSTNNTKINPVKGTMTAMVIPIDLRFLVTMKYTGTTTGQNHHIVS